MQHLPAVDIAVLVIYMVGVVAFGCWFVRKSGSTDEFMAAGRSLPGWAVGLSMFGTYLSSNTFLGNPGMSFAGNWNGFVPTLTLPIAGAIAVWWFVPFYRRSGEISAYHHLEHRFGAWARTYAVVCFLLLQIARTGAVLFGVALALAALTGWNMTLIIALAGVLITVYTVLGGIEAVIWTDVVQSIVLLAGAILVLLLIVLGMPEGPGQIIQIAASKDKFSLGSFELSFTTTTVIVMLLFGIFDNLKNFGIDQSFVQRYHTAKSDSEANRSVWIVSFLYVPVSLMFFFIGTSLFAYFSVHPEENALLREYVARKQLVDAGDSPTDAEVVSRAEQLTIPEIGDKALPRFIVSKLPLGAAGLLIAAILAAAMSSIDTSLNSSATVIYSDIYKRYFRPNAGEKESMRVLHVATILMGAVGTGIAIALIGTESLLKAWWTMSGVISGGLLGLFLLSIIARRADKPAAVTGVVVGLLAIVWAIFSPPGAIQTVFPSVQGDIFPPALQNPFDGLMTIVIGTLTIFFVGLLVARLRGVQTKPR